MAPILRALRRQFLSSSFSSSETFIRCLQQSPVCLEKPGVTYVSLFQIRTYISELRRSAFEGNILRLIRNDIQYELERSPPQQPVTEFGSYIVEERPGERWILLRRKFGGNEDIKIEATMFDGSGPGKNSGEDIQLHITLILSISKDAGESFLEFVCSAWPDSVEIEKVYMRGHDQMHAQTYMGPKFEDLDDKLQDMLYEFLDERGINDELAVFLHEYMRKKDRMEYMKWLTNIKTFIEKKVK